MRPMFLRAGVPRSISAERNPVADQSLFVAQAQVVALTGNTGPGFLRGAGRGHNRQNVESILSSSPVLVRLQSMRIP